MRIERLALGDEPKVEEAAHLFDRSPDAAATHAFLGMPNHHLLIAYQDGVPVGFVSGVELTHPDKGTEMFLYELGVDEPFRRRGIGRSLVEALLDLARQRGCYGMWVLADADNEAASATYGRSGGSHSNAGAMFTWKIA